MNRHGALFAWHLFLAGAALYYIALLFTERIQHVQNFPLTILFLAIAAGNIAIAVNKAKQPWQ